MSSRLQRGTIANDVFCREQEEEEEEEEEERGKYAYVRFSLLSREGWPAVRGSAKFLRKCSVVAGCRDGIVYVSWVCAG